MQPSKVERVRGTNDVSPTECVHQQQIATKIQQCFQSFGYRSIELPILEPEDLYLRKSGEEIITKMYDFVYQNRHLCLRPEITASVARTYVDSQQSMSLPVRLQYNGAVFRYERPQYARYRQFTQVGIELIGAADAMADAEVIAAACHCIEKLGITDDQVVVGHMGILAKFLESLGLESRLRTLLLTNMAKMRTAEGQEHVHGLLRDIYPGFDDDASDRPAGSLGQLFRGQSEEESKETILELLANLNIELSGNRSEAEIADRLLTKFKRQDQTKQIRQALEFMKELGQIQGSPLQVFAAATVLLTKHGGDRSALDALQEISGLLEFHQLNNNKITIDLGLSRGLQYYTGMVFEVHHSALGDGRQLCGGGRYDELVANLGGEPTPATGCSFGLERLRLALEQEGKLEPIVSKTQVLVVPVTTDDAGYAITITTQLRQAAINTELDIRHKRVPHNLQQANKQGIPFVIIVGSEEQQVQKVQLKNMATTDQQLLTIEEAIQQIHPQTENLEKPANLAEHSEP
jgi:histidyl-tRNA synthetase